MNKHVKKFISVAMLAVMLTTMIFGNMARVSAETDLNVLGTYQGGSIYIETYTKEYYFGKGTSLEVCFRYDTVDTAVHNFNKTLEYKVFDENYSGWQNTSVGPNGYDQTLTTVIPKVGDTYTIRVPFSVIEGKYRGTDNILGINLQTGYIGNSTITILSHKIVGDASLRGSEFTATGSWKKGIGGTMVLNRTPDKKAVISANEWNIKVSQFILNEFSNPTVDVTVEYKNISGYRLQAEILVNEQPVNPNYVVPRKTGTMTYTTELPTDTTSFVACYDDCIVKKIHVYDNKGTDPAKVTGKGAEDINANLNPAWNLGNALESVNDGVVSETAWGNPVVTQKIFQTVKEAGFNSVRIPISYLDKVDANGNIDQAYLARIKKVVHAAWNSGLYVIINIHHDSGDVKGKWLDISKTGDDFVKIQNKFTKMWQQIASTFKDYDQHLVFESMDEVTDSGCYAYVPASAYQKINALNQSFVNAVRSAGGNNMERCLIIPGYASEINLTAVGYGTSNGFQVPIDSTPNKLILAVKFFDPYNFTSNMASNVTTITAAELRYIGTQFTKIKTVTELPVFVSFCGAVDKNNIYDRADYLDRMRKEADKAGITLAYWDNGCYKEGGFAIFDRQSNEITEDGEILLSAIMGTYDS